MLPSFTVAKERASTIAIVVAKAINQGFANSKVEKLDLSKNS